MTLATRAPGICAGYADARLITRADGLARYDAVEQGTERRVELKVSETSAPHVREALATESSILAALGSHPYIVTLYQRTETDDGRPMLVLERCLGSFAELFQFVRTPAPSAVRLAIKIAGALETAHRAGVVHTSIRPQNLALTEWNEPVVRNFETATRVADRSRAVPLLHDPSVHTAPEVLLGDRATQATDVYGLAATLYELVAGRSIFRSYAGESAAEISAHVFCETVAPLSAADVPLELSDLLLWALNADPTARPPSASWLAEELRRIEDHNGWPRTPMIVGATTVPGGWMTR